MHKVESILPKLDQDAGNPTSASFRYGVLPGGMVTEAIQYTIPNRLEPLNMPVSIKGRQFVRRRPGSSPFALMRMLETR